MCGFVAIISPTEMPGESELAHARDLLAHRGPDSARNTIIPLVGQKGGVGLGFRRLSIQDLSMAADQPMVSADGKRSLVFNGEIYNFWEIRRELEARGRRFRTNSDTEVLLQSYEEWGVRCVDRFNGMFSFFIWDASLRVAFIARDRFGEKPLYFARGQDGVLAFASEIKALLAIKGIICEPNMDYVDALNGQNGAFIHSTSVTAFRTIERFQAAHFMVVDDHGIVKAYDRYWTPNYDDVDRGLSTNAASEQLYDLIEKSIIMRTRSDVAGAACLSGGLDSSTIVGHLARSKGINSNFRFHETISARFPDDPTIDEGYYINKVRRELDVAGRDVTYTPDDVVKNLHSMHWHHEEAIPGLSMYLEWGVMRKAKELGYKVMLDGQGADELLAGYTHYFQYFQHDAYSSGDYTSLVSNILPQKFRLWKLGRKFDSVHRRVGSDFVQPFSNFRDLLRDTWMDPAPFSGREGLPACIPGNELRYKLATEVLYASLPTQLHSGDRNSMAHGVETRYPFLDYNLADWCIRLPVKHMIRYGFQKYILRRAGKSLLPRSVRLRADKVGYLSPQDRWLRGQQVGEWMADNIDNKELDNIPSFDRLTIQRLRDQHMSGDADNSDILWRWASVSEWLSMFQNRSWTKQRER